MKQLILCLSIFGLVIASSFSRASAADQNAVATATRAADSWLKLIDDGKYSESWTQTSAFFQERVPQGQWIAQASAARDPLGSLTSRKLAGAHYTTSLPGAPDGHYVVLQYKSSFANKKSAVETVTPMREADGQWRVSGYYIR
jgi:hypothetical protein